MTYFLAPGELSEGASLVLQGEEAQHLLKARRMRAGERFALQDARGRRFWAELVGPEAVQSERRGVRVQVLGAAPIPTLPDPPVRLWLASVKDKAAELVVPQFREAALLAYPEMLAAVTALNRQITELAPVLNSPTIGGAAAVKSENADVPVAMMVKRHDGATFLFAVGMRDGATVATFALKGIDGNRTVDVLGENRTLTSKGGSFTDNFAPWDAHLYRLPADARP